LPRGGALLEGQAVSVLGFFYASGRALKARQTQNIIVVSQQS
jgi:hypothetical protein